MKAHDRRLRQLEASVPKPDPHAELVALMEWMTGYELVRVGKILERMYSMPNGLPQRDIDDFEKAFSNAEERRSLGQRPDAEDKVDAEKDWSCWSLVMSLGRRGEFGGNDHRRFDLADVTADEISALAKAVDAGMTLSDIAPHAETLSRLWFDDEPLTVERFMALGIS